MRIFLDAPAFGDEGTHRTFLILGFGQRLKWQTAHNVVAVLQLGQRRQARDIGQQWVECAELPGGNGTAGDDRRAVEHTDLH
ncbi:hypothetical protein D1872_324600 [compost metagenome]